VARWGSVACAWRGNGGLECQEVRLPIVSARAVRNA
jgi:hypothetical protein